MKHILKCKSCGKHTLKEKCSCGGIAANIKPPKFSPEDNYAKYRRKYKSDERKKDGLV